MIWAVANGSLEVCLRRRDLTLQNANAVCAARRGYRGSENG